MANLILHADARGKPWEPPEIAEMLVFCQHNMQELLRACPADFAEDALSRGRLFDLRRKPRPSDTADLFHRVAALAYADVFVTAEGWANDQARERRSRCGDRASTRRRCFARWLSLSKHCALRKPIVF